MAHIILDVLIAIRHILIEIEPLTFLVMWKKKNVIEIHIFHSMSHIFVYSEYNPHIFCRLIGILSIFGPKVNIQKTHFPCPGISRDKNPIFLNVTSIVRSEFLQFSVCPLSERANRDASSAATDKWQMDSIYW